MKSIIFQDREVRLLQMGNLQMFIRKATPSPLTCCAQADITRPSNQKCEFMITDQSGTFICRYCGLQLKSPYGKDGETIYVKENFAAWFNDVHWSGTSQGLRTKENCNLVLYPAEKPINSRLVINRTFMPEYAARYRLRQRLVQLHGLMDTTQADCIKLGLRNRQELFDRWDEYYPAINNSSGNNPLIFKVEFCING